MKSGGIMSAGKLQMQPITLAHKGSEPGVNQMERQLQSYNLDALCS